MASSRKLLSNHGLINHKLGELNIFIYSVKYIPESRLIHKIESKIVRTINNETLPIRRAKIKYISDVYISFQLRINKRIFYLLRDET